MEGEPCTKILMNNFTKVRLISTVIPGGRDPPYLANCWVEGVATYWTHSTSEYCWEKSFYPHSKNKCKLALHPYQITENEIFGTENIITQKKVLSVKKMDLGKTPSRIIFWGKKIPRAATNPTVDQ